MRECVKMVDNRREREGMDSMMEGCRSEGKEGEEGEGEGYGEGREGT